MTKTIEMQWDENVTVLGEHCPADKLDRAKYAQFLTGFLAGQGFDETKDQDEQKKNYVLNLNSEWGSGKTYFLKRWYHDLTQHYPVVYVDAWKQDYSDDPLMTVISSMTKQLREQAGKAEDDPKFKAPRKALGLLKAALPSAAGALAKRYLGIDPVAIMEAADEGEVGETIKDAEGKDIDMGAAASKLVQYLLDEHDAKSDAISSLKKSVEQWIQAVVGLEQRQYPAFIFIDELDRCRPSYAVEMLETIKHIFDIPGVVFVVGTDTEQLQHAVKAIYGEGFDARTYLGRFFNSRCTLEQPSFKNLLETHCDLHKLSSEYFQQNNIATYPKTLDSLDSYDAEGITPYRNLTKVFEAFNLQARQVIQITNRLISIIDNLNSGVFVDLVYLTFLLCLKEKNIEAYNQLIKNPALISMSSSSGVFSQFIILETLCQKLDLYISFVPRELTPHFTEKNSVTKINNSWEPNIYHCNILAYVQKTSEAMISDANAKRVIESELANALREQRLVPSKRDKRAFGSIWVAIEFSKQQLINGQSLNFYRNLVDLSSALDSVELT
ncbi:NTPase KAP [Vibrio fluvialis]